MRKWVIIVLIILSLHGFALAQSAFCGNLSDADCDILVESGQAMASVEGLAFHLDMTMGFADSSGFMGGDIGFRIVGDGTFAANAEQMALLNQSSPGDLENLPALSEQVIKSVSADMSLFIELPALLTGTFSTPGSQIPTRIPFDFRLLDGLAYVNLDKISDLDPSVPQGWYGLDLAALYRLILEQQGAFGIAQGSGGTDMGTLERIEDTVISGQDMAVFRTTFEFDELLEDPIFRESFRNAFRDSLLNQGMSLSQVNQLLEVYVDLLNEMEFAATQSIGLDDKYLHNITFTLDWNLNLDELMSAMGEPSMGGMGEFDFAFDFSLNLYQFNDVPPIEEPEGATIIPMSMLIPLILQGAGQT